MKSVHTLEERIAEYSLKIEEERLKAVPSEGRIEHWLKEIKALDSLDVSQGERKKVQPVYR